MNVKYKYVSDFTDASEKEAKKCIIISYHIISYLEHIFSTYT